MINDLVRSYGLEISPSKKPGTICAVGALEYCFLLIHCVNCIDKLMAYYGVSGRLSVPRFVSATTTLVVAVQVGYADPSEGFHTSAALYVLFINESATASGPILYRPNGHRPVKSPMQSQ